MVADLEAVEVIDGRRRSAGFVSAEFKAADRWDKRYNRGLKRMRAELGDSLAGCFGVYLGDRSSLWDDVHILPAGEFLQRLWNGDILR